MTEFNPDYLFHLGAYTDLEFCGAYAHETYNTNTLAVENAVYLANELNIPVLYISTAGIFDGAKDFYDDWDQPNPLGVYARANTWEKDLSLRMRTGIWFAGQDG